MVNVRITVRARIVPLSLAVFGFGLLRWGSSFLVSLPISTAGCSLNVVFSGLLGDGSPMSRSMIMASTRMVTAVNSAIMWVHPVMS